MKRVQHDDLSLPTAAARFAALGSEQRLSVLLTLVRAGPGGLSIGALGLRCGITGSTLTFHVKALAQSGLVRRVRAGRNMICVADIPEIRGLSDFLLAECCAEHPAEGSPSPGHPKDHDHG